MSSFYERSVAHDEYYRVIGDGVRLMQKLLLISDEHLVLLSHVAFLSLTSNRGEATVPAAHLNYYTHSLQLLGFKIFSTIYDLDKVHITCECPFTLPDGYRLEDMFFIYQEGDDAIGIELVPDVVGALIK